MEPRKTEFHENDIVFGGNFDAVFEKDADTAWSSAKQMIPSVSEDCPLVGYAETIRVHVEYRCLSM
jgi:hypothetical protein